MDLATITAKSRHEALDRHRLYARAAKRRSEAYLGELKRAYWHLARGRGIVDMRQAFAKAGLNAQGDPKLAISRADRDVVRFRKDDHGAGVFENFLRTPALALPEGTFPGWPPTEKSGLILRRYVETKVPIIPAEFLPEGKLSRYHLLWEVERWDAVPSDPALLLRLSRNLFAVMATWELTDLERAIVRGR